MQSNSAAGTPWSRRLAMMAANPRGAVYGTIVAAAVIAASAHDERPGLILAATVATLVVFWLEHVYAEVLAHGLRHARLDLSVVPATMAREPSMRRARTIMAGGAAWGCGQRRPRRGHHPA